MSQEVWIGSPAPALMPDGCVKGEAVEAFTPGRIAVVEFRATWCGPCRAGIPHLSALQAACPQVSVVGIAVMDQEADVREFVQEQGAAMAYAVALNKPAVKPRGGGPAYRAWCEAAYRDGIPASFIVDGAGRIAWIGHPMQLDEPLAAIVAERWDLDAEAEAHRDGLARDKVRETKAMMAALASRHEAGDLPGILKVYDEAFAQHPDFESKWGVGKLGALMDLHADGALA